MLPNAGKTSCPTRGCCCRATGAGRRFTISASRNSWPPAAAADRREVRGSSASRRHPGLAPDPPFSVLRPGRQGFSRSRHRRIQIPVSTWSRPQLDQDPNPALLLRRLPGSGPRPALEPGAFAEPLRRACDHALEHLNPPERAQLWRTLGRLGLDDRPGVGLRDGLPDIAWVEVPAGAFLYGERRKTLPAFRIARYPVTNAQYQTFIDEGGYETDAWWEGLAERPEPARGFWTDPTSRGTPSPGTKPWPMPAGWTPGSEKGDSCRKAEPCGCPPRKSGRKRPAATMAGNSPGANSPRGAPISTKPGAAPESLSRADLRRRPLPGRRFPLRRAGYGRKCLGMVPEQIRKARTSGLKGKARRVVRGGSWDCYRHLARCAYRGGRAPGDRLGPGFAVGVCGSHRLNRWPLAL